jgi:hypothetical protein
MAKSLIVVSVSVPWVARSPASRTTNRALIKGDSWTFMAGTRTQIHFPELLRPPTASMKQ